ncbi:hypothetical protein J4Q44_G00188990 [Coregonus suidteri]|uniref:Uncharacterized protein n=1 Tax=Coregonus suidteri TaxID=861788 RepID=A0AAN8LJJ8_9TELE
MLDDTPVPVANSNVKEYNANPKQIIPFKEFIHYWKEYIQKDVYLKDWHMSRKTPSINHSWLNGCNVDIVAVSSKRAVCCPEGDLPGHR